MKAFIGFIIKEFYHLFRDRRTLVILFGMPIVQLILFGYVIRNEVDDIRIGFLDLSGDAATAEIKDQILASTYFTAAVNFTSPIEVEEAFKAGRIHEAIVFEPQFLERLSQDGSAAVQIVADATDPNFANTIVAYTTSVLQAYQETLVQEVPTARIVPEVRMRYNPTLRSVYQFVPGLMAFILMLVSALMTSITITREKELGTMEILLVSPLQPIQIIAGKVLPYLALSFVNVVTVLAVSRYLFGVPIHGSLALLLLESVLFITCALALGIFISALSNTQQQATMISLTGLLMPTLLLSGFIFPIASMPVLLQWLSHTIPAKWYLTIAKGIMLKGAGLSQLWDETLILLGITLLMLVASLRSFKVRLA